MQVRIVSCYLLSFLLMANSHILVCQNQPPQSDPQAVVLAQQSIAALTSTGINDVTLNANVISSVGLNSERGTATFKAKGNAASRIDLNLSSGTRSDIRNVTSALPEGTWEKNGGTSNAYAFHNCWTDSTWFFPALSSLSQTSNSAFIFKYIGQEQHHGVLAQHIEVFQATAQVPDFVQQLSLMEFYLDPLSYLPLAITFNQHPDDDMNSNIPVEITFANYQLQSRVQVPFHFQQSINGAVALDVTITSVVFNSGLPDTLFTVQ